MTFIWWSVVSAVPLDAPIRVTLTKTYHIYFTVCYCEHAIQRSQLPEEFALEPMLVEVLPSFS